MSDVSTYYVAFVRENVEPVLRSLGGVASGEDRNKLLSALPWQCGRKVGQKEESCRIVEVGIKGWDEGRIGIGIPVTPELIQTAENLKGAAIVKGGFVCFGYIFVTLFVGEHCGVLELSPAGKSVSLMLDSTCVRAALIEAFGDDVLTIIVARDVEHPVVEEVFPRNRHLALRIDDFEHPLDATVLDADGLACYLGHG